MSTKKTVKSVAKKSVVKKATAKTAEVKKATAKTAKAKKVVKKTVRKEKKSVTPKKKTVRVRALEVLEKQNMTAVEVQEAVGIGHSLKPTLDQEVKNKHLKYAPHKDDKGTVTYEITAAGRKALKNNTVNPSRKQK